MSLVRRSVIALLGLCLLGGVASGGEDAPASIPASAPARSASLPSETTPAPLPDTFEELLDMAVPVDAADVAARVVRSDPTAPSPGTLLALETGRVVATVGSVPEEVILRVPPELFVPEYATRLDPGDESSPIGPLFTAGVPGGIAPPDFASSMTYMLSDTPPAVEVSMRFPTRDDAARFRLGARDGALRAQLVLRLERVWMGSVLDPYTKRTTIDEHGVSKTYKGKGPRRDKVVGAACRVVGHRIYFDTLRKKGTIVASTPESSGSSATRLVPPSERKAIAARADAEERAEEKLRAALSGPDVSDDLAACRAARDRKDFRAAFESCTRVLEADSLHGEAAGILKSLPRTVAVEALREAVAGIRHRVKRCGTAGTAPVKVELLVTPEGRVVAAGVFPPHTGTPTGRCVADVSRTLRLPSFMATKSVRITYVFAIW